MKHPATTPKNKSKRKRTRKQLEASRRNGSRSKGPLTDAGKDISSRNAAIHGLTAQKNLLLGNESAPALDLVRHAYFDRFQPADPVEADLVDQMVSAQWRLRRYSGVETALLDQEMDRQRTTLPPPSYEGERCARAFKSLADDSNSLALTGRYLSRLTRDYYRAMNAFSELRRNIPPQPGASPLPAVILPGLPGVNFPNEPKPDLTPSPSTVKGNTGASLRDTGGHRSSLSPQIVDPRNGSGDTEGHSSTGSPRLVDPRVPPIGRRGQSGVSPSTPRTSNKPPCRTL